MRPDAQIFRQTLSEETRRLGFAPKSAQLDGFCLHYELLLKWNPRVRLVAGTEPARAAIELFADSLVPTPFIDSLAAGTHGGATPKMIDIGAGGGLPGIALKLARPEWHLAVIDSNSKKLSFLKTLARELRLADTRIIRGRAETLAHRKDLRGQFDLAFCRAVAPPAVACELAVPFLKVGGSFIAQIAEPHRGEPRGGETHGGKPSRRPIEDIGNAAAALGATIDEIKSYNLTGLASGRSLVRVRKLGATPCAYPRDTRAMRKRPLA